MISLAVIAATAAAFWTPYNGGAPVCPGGVQAHVVATVEIPAHLPVRTMAYSFVRGGCEVWITRRALTSPAYACAAVAHELGHSAMGLEHSSDPRNIMFARASRLPACDKLGRAR